MPLVLGVDSSTQSTKVELRDADDGRLVATGRAPHPPTVPPRSEQDPAAWWVALRAAVGSLPRVDIAAIAVAAQQMGLVTLDSAWQPVRPAKLWNDTESADQSRRLVLALGAAEWARACGSVPVASFTITKLAWLKEREPSSWERVARVLVPHDWLTWRLTGRFVTDRGDASGTGWWSPAEERYREDLLALVDDRRDWRPRAARSARAVRSRRPGHARRGAGARAGPLGSARGAGDRRQHGGRAGRRAAGRRGRLLARHFGDRLRGVRARRRRRNGERRELRGRDGTPPAARVHTQRDQGDRHVRARPVARA